MCIGPQGDNENVPAGECAVRLARAGTAVKQFSVAHRSKTCVGTRDYDLDHSLLVGTGRGENWSYERTKEHLF